MVKDGLQLGYASLVEAISPFMMTAYLDKINSVRKALKEEAEYESVFGLTKEELTAEFANGYLLSNINNKLNQIYFCFNFKIPFKITEIKINKNPI